MLEPTIPPPTMTTSAVCISIVRFCDALREVARGPKQDEIVVSFQQKDNIKREEYYDAAISGVAANSLRV
jgi:hypothetical protein